jgi:Cu+-exporting ATPase
MAKDPVCGMQVDEQQAAEKSEHQGQTFYFCSPGCRQQFEQNPARYTDPRVSHTIQPNEGGPCVP